jgi:hypothetical protein
MGIEQVTIMGVIIIVLMVIIVLSFDLVIPMVLKLEFNSICRNYTLLAESQNGLSSDDISKMLNEIEALNLTVVKIDCPSLNSPIRGLNVNFEIEALYEGDRFDTLFKRIPTTLPFSYKRSFIGRKVVL